MRDILITTIHTSTMQRLLFRSSLSCNKAYQSFLRTLGHPLFATPNTCADR
jgi:hypothetical protein